MPDPCELSLETFAGRIGEPFRIQASDDVVIDVVLTDAARAGEASSPGARAPFSILFGGPADVILPQRIYTLEHEALGSLELFLVPLQPTADGTRYQAIFS